MKFLRKLKIYMTYDYKEFNNSFTPLIPENIRDGIKLFVQQMDTYSRNFISNINNPSPTL